MLHAARRRPSTARSQPPELIPTRPKWGTPSPSVRSVDGRPTTDLRRVSHANTQTAVDPSRRLRPGASATCCNPHRGGEDPQVLPRAPSQGEAPCVVTRRRASLSAGGRQPPTRSAEANRHEAQLRSGTPTQRSLTLRSGSLRRHVAMRRALAGV